jgi:hypothetical protein
MDPKTKEILLEFIGAVRLLTDAVAKLNRLVWALEDKADIVNYVTPTELK